MKTTRTLLLTAALWLSVTFQAVSYNVTLQPGLNLFANNLDTVFDFSTLPGIPGVLTVSKYNRTTGSFESAVYDPDVGGWSAVVTLAHGEGAIVDNDMNNGGPITITVGGPQIGTIGGTVLGSGWHLIGSQTTGLGTFETIVGGPPGVCPGTELLRWTPYVTGAWPPGANSGWVTYTYNATGWSPTTPIMNEGEAVWLNVPSGSTCGGSGVFTYSVSGVSPSVGGVGCALTTLQVAGAGFLPGATMELTMGGQPPIPSSTAPTVLNGGFILSADFNLTGAAPGTWSVDVYTSGSLVPWTPSPSFTINPLSVTAVTPSTGSKCSTVTLTISGAGFCPNPTVNLVNVSASPIPASGVVLSSLGTELTATFNIPDVLTGAWDVEVTNPGGSPVVLAAGFSILPHALFSVTPNVGGACGTIELTAMGSSICPNSQMRLIPQGGGAPVVDLAPVIHPQAGIIIGTFNVSGAAPGVWDLEVVSPGGSPTLLPGAFTIGPTVLNSVSPSSGGTCSPFTLRVQGHAICPGSTIQLTSGGQAPIVGTSPAVNASQTEIQATFTAGTAQSGSWTIEVIDPNNNVSSLGTPFLIQPLTLTAVVPNTAGTCGSIRLVAGGTGFAPGMSMSLVDPNSVLPDIVGNNFIALGTALAGNFNLTGAGPGVRDAVITCASGSFTLPAAFTVTASAASVNLVQPNDGKQCQPISFNIRGACFAPGSTVLLRSGATTVLPATTTVIDSQHIACTLNPNTATAALSPWVVEVTSPGNGTAALGGFTVFACTGCDVEVEMQGPSAVAINRNNTFAIRYKNLSAAATYSPVALSVSDIPADALITIVSATPHVITGSGTSPKTISFNVTLTPGQEDYFYFTLNLPSILPPMNLHASVTAPCLNDDILQTEVVFSADPNDKRGLAGAGANHYIIGVETLPYKIHFENKAAASAPAQEVFIKDYLDPVRLDLSTFSLGPITFGSHTVTPPPGLTSFVGYELYDVDGNPATTADGIVVQVKADLINSSLDPNYGRLIWSLRSLDPITGLLPSNPLFGFLPPNVTAPQGEGTVSYTVKAKPGLASGEVFGSGAKIEFDLNEPIFTPIWINVIDNIAPSSQVQPLPAVQNSTAITLSWSGTDAESGVASFDVYVADDAGPYVKWLSGTTATSATFIGQVNHTYRFYSVAIDQVGQVEAAPNDPDATSTVQIAAPALTIRPAVIVSWPSSASASGYVLRWATDITGPYTDYPGSIYAEGNDQIAPVVIGPTQRFFQLFKP